MKRPLHSDTEHFASTQKPIFPGPSPPGSKQSKPEWGKLSEPAAIYTKDFTKQVPDKVKLSFTLVLFSFNKICQSFTEPPIATRTSKKM